MGDEIFGRITKIGCGEQNRWLVWMAVCVTYILFYPYCIALDIHLTHCYNIYSLSLPLWIYEYFFVIRWMKMVPKDEVFFCCCCLWIDFCCELWTSIQNIKNRLLYRHILFTKTIYVFRKLYRAKLAPHFLLLVYFLFVRIVQKNFCVVNCNPAW